MAAERIPRSEKLSIGSCSGGVKLDSLHRMVSRFSRPLSLTPPLRMMGEACLRSRINVARRFQRIP